MKAIMISIKPEWCAKIMNGDKTIEVRKNKALASAIQKLIDKNGYADIYVYCTKDKKQLTSGYSSDIKGTKYFIYNDNEAIDYRGKVVFKFRCYKVDKLFQAGTYFERYEDGKTILKNACLNIYEFEEYRKGKPVYAINISDLEIFDKPKELSKFSVKGKYTCSKNGCPYFATDKCRYASECLYEKTLTKAPQNYCYIDDFFFDNEETKEPESVLIDEKETDGYCR